MKAWSILLATLLLGCGAFAGASANYTLAPDALDSGGAPGISASYSLDGSTTPGQAGASANYTAFAGYAGQLILVNAVPILSIPASPVIAEAVAADAATVTFLVTASDAEDGVLSPVVTPASGSVFPFGDTTVMVSATDSLGATSTGSFIVRVRDTIVPQITFPSGTQRAATGPLADYRPLATVTDATATSIAQSPAIGLNTAPGLQTITLTATDRAGNESAIQFILDVRPTAPVTMVVRSSGDPAPGRGTPTGPPTDALLASFGVPATDADGDVAYMANWTSTTTRTKGTGLFLNDSCVAILGGEVAGIGSPRYKTFTDPLVDAGIVACLGTLTGTPKGQASAVFSTLGTDTLAPIVQTATEAPGTQGALFKKFKAVALSQGFVAFHAQLANGKGTPKTTAANDLGVWVKAGNNAPVLFVREGDSINGRIIKTLIVFMAGAGSPGQGRGWLNVSPEGDASVLALAVFTDRSQAVIAADLSGLRVLSSGDFASHSLPAANGAGHLAFLATLPLGGSVTKANARGIFADTVGSGELIPIARVTDAAAAADPGATFSLLKDPVLAADGALAFPATLRGGSARGAAAQTLWWSPPDAPLELLARGGPPLTPAQIVPGVPTGAEWKTFTSLGITAGRGPIFTATLTAKKGGVIGSTANGVWAMDFTQTLRLLFRTGDNINGRFLKSFTLLNTVVGSPGVSRSISDGDGDAVVWRAVFTDKSTAIMVTQVP